MLLPLPKHKPQEDHIHPHIAHSVVTHQTPHFVINPRVLSESHQPRESHQLTHLLGHGDEDHLLSRVKQGVLWSTSDHTPDHASHAAGCDERSHELRAVRVATQYVCIIHAPTGSCMRMRVCVRALA